MVKLTVLNIILVPLVLYSQVFIDNTGSCLPENYKSKYVDVGDIDLDSDIDIIAKYEGQIDILINTNGIYSIHESIYTESSLGFCKLIDIDSDRDLDLLIINSGQDYLYQNQGDGTFVDITSQSMPTVFGLSEDIDVGDIDFDGDLDFIMASESAIDFESGLVYVNISGNGVFHDNTNLLGSLIPYLGEFKEISLHDVDADTYLDIWFGLNPYAGFDPNSTLIKSDVSGFDIQEPSYYDYRFLNAYDIDLDGDIDIFSRNVEYPSNTCNLMVNNGDGVYFDETESRLPGDSFRVIQIGELDNINGPDLIVSNLDTLSIYFNTGNGYFINSTSEWLDNSNHQYESDEYRLFDADNDGDLDLYTTGSYYVNDKLFYNTMDNGGAVSISQTSLSAYTPALADGLDSINVYIQVKDVLEQPLTGSYVKIYSNGPDITVTQPIRYNSEGVTTDSYGMVVGSVRSVSQGYIEILCIVDDHFITSNAAILHFLNEPSYGDVNADYTIDVLDIIRIVNIIIGYGVSPTNYELQSADSNSDDSIDVTDIIQLVSVILET